MSFVWLFVGARDLHVAWIGARWRRVLSEIMLTISLVMFFFKLDKFYLLSNEDLCVIDVRLVHEFLVDGDGYVFEIVNIREDPWIPCGRLLDAAVHREDMLDLFYVVDEADGHTNDQEQMGDIGVDLGDDVVVRWRKEDHVLFELWDR